MTPKDYLHSKHQEIVDLETMLTSHVAIAPEGEGDGETEKANALEAWLKAKGFKDIVRYEAQDSRVSSGSRPNLIATIPGKDTSRNIWVIAHTDVVPVGDIKAWNTDPFKVVEKDGKLYGRGVEDDQQGLCSGVFAALYYIENNLTPAYTVKLLFAADEENGSEYGMLWLMREKKLFKKDDYILIPDGGDELGKTIEIAEKNIMWLSVDIKGQQSHGSTPNHGKNACLAGCDLALRINNLENVFNKKDDMFSPDYSTFQPTKRAKNVDSINIIPGEDHLCFDCRILPCYTLAEVTAQVDKICRDVEAKYGVTISYTAPQKSESPATSKDSPVAQKLAAAIRNAQGIEPEFIGIGGGTVAAELRREGIDAAVWSTLKNTCHQPNEYAVIENLIKDAETLIEFFK